MAVALPKRIPRGDLPPGECLCDYCTAKCCRYFALPLEKPTEWSDFQYIRWYLLHGQASVFVEDGVWYLIVHTVCKHLQPDNRCGIYETRPTICREYSTNDCEYEDDFLYEQYLETGQQVFEYAEAILPKKKGQSIRSPKPPLLQML